MMSSNAVSDRPVEAGRADRLSALALVAGLLASVFSKNEVVGGLSVGELLLAFLVLLTAGQVIVIPKSIAVPRNVALMLTLLVVALVGATVNILSPRSAFDAAEFLGSFVKLSFYCLASLSIGVVVGRCTVSQIARIVTFFLVCNTLAGLYVLVSIYTGVLPYEFLWTGQHAPIGNVFVGGDQSIVRLRGLFSEPSLFGAFQALGLGYLLLVANARVPMWLLAVTAFSVVLSFSLTAYGLLLVVLCLHSFRGDQARSLLTSFGLLVFGLLAALVASEQFAVAIVGRSLAVAGGADLSSFGRVVATWELPVEILKSSPIVGAGLGNMDSTFAMIGYRLRYERILVENPNGWNVIAYVLGSMGALGCGVFLIFCADMMRVSGRAALVFFAYLFTTGALLEPTFWVFYSIYYHSGRLLSDGRQMRLGMSKE